MPQIQTIFFLVRYFPDVVRDEAINIGVVLVPMEQTDEQVPRVRFTKNWRRVLCLDPDADTEMLSQIADSLQADLLAAKQDAPQLIEKLHKNFSTLLRLESAGTAFGPSIGAGRGVLADNLDEEVDRLMAMYVEDRIRGTESEE